jgi:hypothetical protein
MRIVADRPEYRPTWLYTEVLDRIWRATGSPYVATWNGIPVFPDWFDHEGERPVAFKTGNMNLQVVCGAGRIYFLGGRHRTRWLMSRFPMVPVGLEEQHYDEAVSLGLASRRVVAADFLATFD